MVNPTKNLLLTKLGPSHSVLKEKPALVKGQFYPGVVIGNQLPNNIINVKLKGLDVPLKCVWVAGILSGMVGFKTSYAPPRETEVLVLYSESDVSYVIGTIPNRTMDPGNQESHVVDPNLNYQNLKQTQSQKLINSPVLMGHKPPVDLTEGEFDMTNSMGVGITLLQNIAALKGGDLARVECHVLDDMVRIMSDTFQHFTAFGNHTISNDGGKLNVIWHGTSNEHEAWGNQRPQDPRVGMTDEDHVNLDSLEGFSEDGRWRYSQFIGWIGNFVNIFVTDPVQALGKLAASGFRSGKARMHVNNDGSILFQSVADIVLEKVVRIPVPMQLRREADPAGNRTNEGLKHQEYLKSWQPSSDNLCEMVFQLRQYARWLNNSYSLSRFYQLDRDWLVPSEANTPLPTLAGDEADKAEVNEGVKNWNIAYSTIRIFRDGSILTLDPYGNAFLSSSFGMQLSTPKDILLQAGGSVNIVAGRDINLLARKNVGITAVTQLIRLKAETGLQMFSNAGHVVLEAAANFVIKLLSDLNVNDQVQISKTGTIDAMLQITGLQVAAAATMVNDSVIPHDLHLFQGAPAVAPVDAKFTFQSDYGAGDIYETLTQQMMQQGDVASGGTWSFSDNTVAAKGTPWPGAGAQQKQFRGGDPLGTASAKTYFTNQPDALTTTPINLKTA